MSSNATCMNNSNNGILNEPPGIGSILVGPEMDQRHNSTKSPPASLRRTLSADMSSKKWMLQNGFSPLKRIASSEELQSEPVLDLWNNKNSKQSEQEQQPGQCDIWSSILSQKPSSLPPPYVHPLVKQSKASLTGKSLEICTENLGSESGSDGFSSYSSSEISSDEERDDEVEEAEEEMVEESTQSVDKEEMAVVHINYSTSSSVSRKSPPRSFPPPLPSRPGLHIRPHREEGRLVLQAISLPTNNCFHAQRQDGRLLLTFVKSPSQTSIEIDEDDEVIHEVDEVEEEEEFEMEGESEAEEDEVEEEKPMRGFELEAKLNQPILVPTGTINVHRSALMVNKLLGNLTNRNPTWSHKLEKLVELEETTTDPTTTLVIPQSLPSPPPRRAMPRLIPSPTPATTVTSCFNTYEYSWRRKPASVTCGGAIHHHHPLSATKQSLPINKNTNNNNNNNNFLVPIKNSKAYQDPQQFVVVKRTGEKQGDFLMKSCKEPRRSLLSWEPYCIATS